MQNTSIAATLTLTDGKQREVCEMIRRFHTGRWPMFRRMLDIRRSGDALIELAQWRDGGFAVVRWSLINIAIRWHNHTSLRAARAQFHNL